MFVTRLLAVSFSLTVATYAYAQTQEWSYKVKRDEFTDTSVHTAYVDGMSSKGFALARCDENKVFSLVFSVDEFIGSRGSYPVRYRIDKNDAVSERWGVSTKGTAVFAGSSKINLSKALMSGSVLLIEITDYRGTPHKGKFSLKASSTNIGKVLSACGLAESLEAKAPSNRASIDGVAPEIVKFINTWGEKSTVCSKKMLSALKYEITDFSSVKSRDFYEAAQNYIKDKSQECNAWPANQTCLFKLWDLYVDTKNLDLDFTEACKAYLFSE